MVQPHKRSLSSLLRSLFTPFERQNDGFYISNSSHDRTWSGRWHHHKRSHVPFVSLSVWSCWPSSHSNFDLRPSLSESTKKKKSIRSELMIRECSLLLQSSNPHMLAWSRSCLLKDSYVLRKSTTALGQTIIRGFTIPRATVSDKWKIPREFEVLPRTFLLMMPIHDSCL